MRSSFVRGIYLALVAAGSLLMLIGCGPDEDEAEQAPQDLWGRSFVSTAVTDDGQPRALVTDTRIVLSFEERGVVRWNAGCNFFGAQSEITAESLLLTRIESTAIGCRDELREQEDWVAGLFGSDPGWQLSDDQLTLTSGATVIELEARHQ